MGKVGPKAKSLQEERGKPVGDAQVIDLERVAAAMTDEMEMMDVPRQVIAGGAVGDVTMAHHSQLFEDVERTMNGGTVDHRESLVDLLVNVLRSDVTGRSFE